MIRFDSSKLRGRIVEKLGTIQEFAKQMGLSQPTIIEKLKGCVDFKVSEIVKACEILEIPSDEIKDYFFSFIS